MPDATRAPSRGTSFDRVADEYDRHRPAYPEELIDRAVEVGGLRPGDRVLEVGCGTGQLTRSLLARGLRVTALEPGDRLVALARENLAGAGQIEFVNARLEDVALKRGRYAAVFSASAIHWVDPDVSWRRAAEALVAGGTLALISYFGLDDERCADDQQALLAALRRISPALAGEWPAYRDLAGTRAGVHERRSNVSEAWSWLGGYQLARDDAGPLFDEAEIATVPTLVEHSADELNALLATMSFWPRLSARQRGALVAENRALQERLGRPIRSATVACLVTARRADTRHTS